MKRLIRKAGSFKFLHYTTTENFDSIMSKGLVPGLEVGMQDNSKFNAEGIYFYTDNEVRDIGFDMCIEAELDSSNMIPDPEDFSVSGGEHMIGYSEYAEIVRYIVTTPLFRDKYAQLLNYDENEDFDDWFDENVYDLQDMFYKNNYELAKLVTPERFNSILTAYIYLGTVDTRMFKKIYLGSEMKEFDHKDIEGMKQYLDL